MWHFGIWFSSHGGVGQMAELDDLRGLFQPIILWFYNCRFSDFQIFIFCLWQIHSYLIVWLLYTKIPTNHSQIISISFCHLFLHQTIKYCLLRHLTNLSFWYLFYFHIPQDMTDSGIMQFDIHFTDRKL